ncbi:gas vesicle accessory protein GvpU [Rummeliibacillus sp. JY-2-4R]
MQNDVVLQTFNHLANKITGFQADITLNINGTIISGTLISNDEYRERLIQSLKEKGLYNISAENGEDLEKFLTKIKKVDEEIENYKFINLLNAQFLLSNGHSFPLANGFLWRGKIESVDGFTLGQFKISY